MRVDWRPSRAARRCDRINFDNLFPSPSWASSLTMVVDVTLDDVPCSDIYFCSPRILRAGNRESVIARSGAAVWIEDDNCVLVGWRFAAVCEVESGVQQTFARHNNLGPPDHFAALSFSIEFDTCVRGSRLEVFALDRQSDNSSIRVLNSIGGDDDRLGRRQPSDFCRQLFDLPQLAGQFGQGALNARRMESFGWV